MSTHITTRRSARKRRNIHVLNPMSEQPHPNGRPSPRDIFMLWLLSLPDDANKAKSARDAIARLDASPARNSETEELRALLIEATLVR